MKKISLFITLAVFTVSTISAQNQKGKVALSPGAGYSLVGLFASALSSVINDNASNTSGTDIKTTAIPVIGLNADYAVADKFSIGLGYSYQSLNIKYNRYYNDTAYIYGDFKDVISRQNFGIRPLFHFSDSENSDIYAGARLSYTMWSYRSDSNQDYSSQSIFTGRPAFQALFGMRYFFNDFVGANMELAVGPPYFAFLGLSFKF